MIDSDDDWVPSAPYNFEAKCNEPQSRIVRVSPAASSALAVVPAPLNESKPEMLPAIRKSRWTLFIAARLRRSDDQKALAAARMRDARARIMSVSRALASKKKVDDMLVKLRSVGLLRDGSGTKANFR